MCVEIFATIIVFSLAVFIFYRNIRKKSSGNCSCSGCSKECPYNKGNCSKK